MREKWSFNGLVEMLVVWVVIGLIAGLTGCAGIGLNGGTATTLLALSDGETVVAQVPVPVGTPDFINDPITWEFSHQGFRGKSGVAVFLMYDRLNIGPTSLLCEERWVVLVFVKLDIDGGETLLYQPAYLVNMLFDENEEMTAGRTWFINGTELQESTFEAVNDDIESLIREKIMQENPCPPAPCESE